MRKNTPQVFWERVKRRGPDECWPWLGGLDQDGYGRFNIPAFKTGRAHRIAWFLGNNQELPSSVLLLHSCDNPPCCNPAHLSPGNNTDNMRHMVARGRSLKGDKNPSRTHIHKMPRGRDNTRTKLYPSDIHVIRALYDDGVSAYTIAKQFGVWPNCINNILMGITWRHV